MEQNMVNNVLAVGNGGGNLQPMLSGHEHEYALAGVNHSIPFPWKLHDMLEAAEKSGFAAIVSWLPDENSFKVHLPDVFVDRIMPLYFKQTKYKSFQRQLNMWGFERLLAGAEKGGYQHEFFVRGKPSLCRHMKRLKIKGTGTKRNDDSSTEGKPNSPTTKRQIKKRGAATATETATKQDIAKLPPTPPPQQIRMLPTAPSPAPPAQTSWDTVVPNFCTSASINGAPTRVSQDFSSAHTMAIEQNLDIEEGLFDEKTLLEVLSNAFAADTQDLVAQSTVLPSDGDSVLFEGRQFFFVEDYHPEKEHNAKRARRRLSIETKNSPSGTNGTDKVTRRFSIEMKQSVTPLARISRRFSLERTRLQAQSVGAGQGRRQSRRFSLERSQANQSNFVLKELPTTGMVCV